MKLAFPIALVLVANVLACQLASAAPPSTAVTVPRVMFNRDIRPILSDNCFACHGPDKNKRQADLRLDQPNRTIIPRNVTGSELIQRINMPEGSAAQMPPAAFHKKLTAVQKLLLTRWVKEGGEYQKHWSYEPPIKASVPAGINPVDFLVHKRLAEIGLKPSQTADRRTLIRRLSFDLLGLPPTSTDAAKFVSDTTPNAYGKLVENLIGNPHYGERMAQGWLDVVRFADTIGYHSDNPRNVWPYRDWVIAAFNNNKPFDQFTREQLAGDLLPNATQETRVGSAFNRLLLTTEEGGAQAKDYEARYLTDRVRAVGTVWLGQTTGCCQCHDHKFDPLKTRDFYTLGAFFADIQEAIIGGREPGMEVPSPEQSVELQRLTTVSDELQKQYNGPHPELAVQRKSWEEAAAAQSSAEKRWTRLKPTKATALGGTNLTIQADGSILAQGANPDKNTYTIETASAGMITGIRLEVLPDGSFPSGGPGRAGNGNFVITEVIAQIVKANYVLKQIKFNSALASIEQTVANENNPYKAWTALSTIDGDVKGEQWGWAILPEVGRPQSLILGLDSAVTLAPGETIQLIIKQNHGTNHTVGKFRLSATSDRSAVTIRPISLPDDIRDAVAAAAASRTAQQAEKLSSYFNAMAPELAGLRNQVSEAKKARDNFEASIPRCLVSVHTANLRTVRILPRGNFLDETGEVVQPATPAFLPAQTGGTRLDLANWIVSRQNPLTARTVMNRLWKQFFGNGLSKVLDDLGAQGEPPANPALLDWLACEFMDSGWDLKHMVRVIVNSATYKQVSTGSKMLVARDPYNREYARQSRFRLEAEEVRDNALAISGLLSLKIGGPSVKPYQPDRYWDNLNFPVRDYIADKGENQYRRGLYTWWQRSFLHPAMLAFDAPSREECTADRGRSNIPQQALVLLNDPSFVEAARVFASRIATEAQGDTAKRIGWAWQEALQRPASTMEIQTLQRVYSQQLALYKADPAAADALLKTGFSPVTAGCDHVELAAWTHVARALLNLHETITRP